VKFRRIDKPKSNEYPKYSHIYFDLMADDGKVLDHLASNFQIIKKFINKIPEELLLHRYEEGKWTIKEILVHIIDDERIFAYRALRNARNDDTPVHGFDQDNYARYSKANDRTLKSIFDEYESVRNSTITLFQYLPEDSFMRSGGGIDENGNVVNIRTVRALAYHIAGHELRHFNIIKERYLNLV
jgi:uncharacterized damage-inducible protein DinB